MAAKRQQPPSQPPPCLLAIPSAEARSKLIERVEKGRQIKAIPIRSESELGSAKREYSKWSDYNNELLKRIFTTPEIADEYSFWGIAGGVINATFGQQVQELHRGIDEKVERLESIVDRRVNWRFRPTPAIPLRPHSGR